MIGLRSEKELMMGVLDGNSGRLILVEGSEIETHLLKCKFDHMASSHACVSEGGWVRKREGEGLF